MADPSAETSPYASLIEKPLPLVQFLLILMFLSAFFVALWHWDSGPSELKFLVFLMAISGLLLCMTFKPNSIGVVILTLIFGTLIASESFVTGVAHMFSGTTTPIIDYRAGASSNSFSIEAVESKLVNKLVSALKDQGVPVDDQTREVIAQHAAGEPVAIIGRRVLSEGAEEPLRWFLFGQYGSEASSLRGNSLFIEHMEFLKSHGLVEFERGRVELASLTDLGRRVAEYVGPDSENLAISADESGIATLEEFVEDFPGLGSVPMMQIDSSDDVSPGLGSSGEIAWVKFQVDSPARYRINVESNDDPYIRLFGPDSLVFIKLNDDSKDGSNSVLEMDLLSGEYYLGIGEYFDQSMDDRGLVITVGKIDEMGDAVE